MVLACLWKYAEKSLRGTHHRPLRSLHLTAQPAGGAGGGRAFDLNFDDDDDDDDDDERTLLPLLPLR